MKGISNNLVLDSSLSTGENTRTEYQLDQKLLESTLSALEKTPKVVRRNSGGFSYVDPVQIIVPEGKRSRVMIRVRLREIRVDVEKKEEPVSYVSCTKVISPTELKDAAESPSAFSEVVHLIDFGEGVIPVHVFHSTVLADGNTVYAFFVPYLECQSIADSMVQQQRAIPVYAVPREVLRLVGATDDIRQSPDFQKACMNYWRNKARGAANLPDSLKFGSDFLVPSGVALAEVDESLRTSLIVLIDPNV